MLSHDLFYLPVIPALFTYYDDDSGHHMTSLHDLLSRQHKISHAHCRATIRRQG